MSSRSFTKGFVERKGWRKLDYVVLFHDFGPITQDTMLATMDPLDILIQKEETEVVIQEHVVNDRCIVPISSDAIEATIDPLDILINREPCLVAY
jgi:hypothetical protein